MSTNVDRVLRWRHCNHKSVTNRPEIMAAFDRLHPLLRAALALANEPFCAACTERIYQGWPPKIAVEAISRANRISKIRHYELYEPAAK